MNQSDLTPNDFECLHEAAQKIFETLVKKIQVRLPALNAILGRTRTVKFPLYSHMTFEDKTRPGIDPVVVGIDVRVDTGAILIQGHIMGEETGTAHFDLPNQELPFGTEQAVLLDQTTKAAQQLADNTMPVLLRLFGDSMSVPLSPAAVLPATARKANV